MSMQNRGRWIVIAIICITLVGHTVFVALPVAQTGTQGLPGLLIGYGLLAGLLFALWRGYDWARWLLFGLSVIGSLWILRLAYESPSAFVVARALHLIIVALLLAAAPSVASFLASQRAGRRKPGEALR
jgi:ABC-type lipoprotein release transport system permease subunit